MTVTEFINATAEKAGRDAFDFLYTFGGFNNCSLYELFGKYADGNCPVYNQDLIEWVGESLENAEAINEAILNYGLPKPFDIYKVIQYGYCWKLEQDLNEKVSLIATALIASAIRNELGWDYELTSEDIAAIEIMAEDIGGNLTEDAIDDFLIERGFKKVIS